jgi:hypothetical protein
MSRLVSIPDQNISVIEMIRYFLTSLEDRFAHVWFSFVFLELRIIL